VVLQALDKVLGTPKAMTIEEIDQVVGDWVRGAKVAKEAGFAGCQLHGAVSSPKSKEGTSILS
jgi:2,4-dienoyl-CoA reductase-like NADH-dependent reductase (Old Yellow Enzyme family)